MKLFSKFYCKYVIDILVKNSIIFRKNKKLYNQVENNIFESYLKLEKILNFENIS